ncbi:tRNA lysidine(34) synthetase TilS [Weissella ceti]|uniref:tRNA(Ile)-lysidine synthase n=1 Tax=Weissella ceti TaxID=759620 RepID=A0ABT3E5R0_9LACO|nr:tRNA lysidine(34) synthetase TilS [Weissella ceti]MCW0953552.1 tRNA lysidine(34) synthetase TilS [Weissella ceti]QVK12314.1 tRNA lysidine(34) synthetase TilS [Weissella ceti]
MQTRVLNANLIQSLRQKQLFNKDDHVLVAVSGGEDSLNLLHWLTSGKLPVDVQPTVSAAYINHQLRADSADEEAFVQRVFENTHNLEQCLTQRLSWDEQPTAALEELARKGRYDALIEMANQIGANILVTAHHEDDQAETILYKLIRGSRLSQLQGMQEKMPLSENLTLVRPFLGLTKENIRTLNNHEVLDWVSDSSNEDVSFARNRLRHVILPEMAQVNTQVNRHLIELGDQLAGQQALLVPVLDDYVLKIQKGQFDWQLPVESCILILQHWLASNEMFDISDRQLRQVVTLMRNQSTNNGVVMLSGGRKFVRRGTLLTITEN